MTLWRGQLPLILASQSRARQLLLANAGIDFKAVPAEIDERAEQQRSGLTLPGDIAALLAREKARSVSIGHPGQFVVGADQTLALGTVLFSKPAGRIQAAEQLGALAGRSHQLHSAVAVAHDGKILFETVAVAMMTMRPSPLPKSYMRSPLKLSPASRTGCVISCGLFNPESVVPSSRCIRATATGCRILKIRFTWRCSSTTSR